MLKYKGKTVTILRDAKVGDDGYKADTAGQVAVRYEDGSVSAVKKAEVVDSTKVELTKAEAHEDPLAFLQRINQKLKNPQTATHPPTVVIIADEIDAYIAKEGFGRPAKKV